MNETLDQHQAPINVVIYNKPAASVQPAHPCQLGRHRWAWLTSGGQACGYCGKPR